MARLNELSCSDLLGAHSLERYGQAQHAAGPVAGVNPVRQPGIAPARHCRNVNFATIDARSHLGREDHRAAIVALSPKLLNALRLRNLGFLALFLLVGIVATAIMPRLFAQEIVIVPMGESWTIGLLSVTTQNFTQFGYVSLSVMTVFAVTLMAYEQSFAQTLLVGMLAGGLVSIVTGLIDLAAASAGMESWLEPFRNARYAFLTSARSQA